MSLDGRRRRSRLDGRRRRRSRVDDCRHRQSHQVFVSPVHCEGGISILGACILHMQAGPAYACIPYLTHNNHM